MRVRSLSGWGYFGRAWSLLRKTLLGCRRDEKLTLGRLFVLESLRGLFEVAGSARGTMKTTRRSFLSTAIAALAGLLLPKQRAVAKAIPPLTWVVDTEYDIMYDHTSRKTTRIRWEGPDDPTEVGMSKHTPQVENGFKRQRISVVVAAPVRGIHRGYAEVVDVECRL